MSITTTAPTTIRPLGWATVAGGLGIVVAGLVATIDVDVADSAWFGFAGAMVLLVTAGVVGLRSTVADVPVAHKALAAVPVTMVLFALAHLFAVVDQDRALPWFGLFMLLSALGLTVAGVALVRAKRSVLPLVTGLWPLTVPIGLALGDVPHFLAITLWGVSWTALGWSLLKHHEHTD